MSKRLTPSMAALLSDVEAFLAEHDLAAWRFGELALGDKHLVPQLRAGRELRFENEQRVRHAMEFLAREQRRTNGTRVANG
jgi:hypothetical protein